MIDLDHFTRQTAGDAALQQELLGLFHAQLADLEARLAAADVPGCDKVDPELPMILHRLRGGAAAIGAGDFAAVLAEAEDHWPRIGTATRFCAALLSATRAMSEEVTRLVASAPDGGLAKPRESR